MKQDKKCSPYGEPAIFDKTWYTLILYDEYLIKKHAYYLSTIYFIHSLKNIMGFFIYVLDSLK